MEEQTKGFGIDDVRSAAERIAPYVLRTPVLRRTIHTAEGAAHLLIKPECLQDIGAFKIRGAYSFMTTLPEDCPGVVAHSSGNHAQAVARAAKVLGLKAVIVMPSNAPTLKRRRTAADGAEVVTVGPDSEERREKANELAESRGLVLVPPYDHPLIAAGQGTVALELLEDVHGLDRLYCPVSGGGLMAGCAEVVGTECPGAEIIGVEPVGAHDTLLSLEAGERRSVPPPATIADGLRVRTPGEWTFEVLKRRVSKVVLVQDEEMLSAMGWALLHLRVLLEPSGAASLAAALRDGEGRCGVVLSGGNASGAALSAVARQVAAMSG